jgi:hypothetical protein
MMQRSQGMRWLVVLPVLLAALAPIRAMAQDDPNDVPLGDVARNLRKKTATPQPVIDDDNLPKVMEQAESQHSISSALQFLMNGQNKDMGFRVSVPDATCSLAFTANARSLLSSQYAQMELPASEAAKLQGPAMIEGDALTVNIFNGTNWHLSELEIALTVIHKTEEHKAEEGDSQFQEIRPEKNPDVTKVYRMRAAASPGEKTVFSAPLNLELAPGDEWHWAIVHARGYPPQDIALGSQP